METIVNGEGRGSYPKGRDRRKAIIATAVQRFSQRGYQASSISEIADECGISRAGLLHHFASKEELLLEVLQVREEQDRQIFIRSGSAQPGGLGVLRGVVNLASHNTTVPGLMRLYVLLAAEAVDADHPAHEYFRQNYRRVRDGTAKAFDHARDAGFTIAGLNSSRAAIDLMALQDGLQVAWLTERSEVDLAGTLERRIESALTVRLFTSPSQRLAPV